LTEVVALSQGYSPVIQGYYNGFHNCPQFGALKFTATSNPIETSGGGGYYLANNDFRAKGTVNPGLLDQQLLNVLKTKTTHPPIAFPPFTFVTGEMALFPQVPRYVAGPPDLGYHYDAMDYTVALMVLDGGTLQVHPGTVVGMREEPEWWGPNYPWTYIGIDLLAGAKLISHGTPASPIIFADVQTVQETSQGPVFALFNSDFWPGDGHQSPEADFRFTQVSVLSGWGYHFLSGRYENENRWLAGPNAAINLTLSDCLLRNGRINFGEGVITEISPPFSGFGQIQLRNNLFLNTDCYFTPNYPDDWLPPGQILVDLDFNAHNNLFRGGVLRLKPSSSDSVWTLTDNLFDKVAFGFFRKV
jgi:hypothetical protein